MVHHATGGLPQGGGRARGSSRSRRRRRRWLRRSGRPPQRSGSRAARTHARCLPRRRGMLLRELPHCSCASARPLSPRSYRSPSGRRMVPSSPRHLARRVGRVPERDASLPYRRPSVPYLRAGRRRPCHLPRRVPAGRLLRGAAAAPADLVPAVPTIHTAVVEYLRERGAPPDHSLRFVRAARPRCCRRTRRRSPPRLVASACWPPTQ